MKFKPKKESKAREYTLPNELIAQIEAMDKERSQVMNETKGYVIINTKLTVN